MRSSEIGLRYIQDVTPRAFKTPYVVKYFADKRLQNITLSEESLEKTNFLWLTFIESNLRCRGLKRTEADVTKTESNVQQLSFYMHIS